MGIEKLWLGWMERIRSALFAFTVNLTTRFFVHHLGGRWKPWKIVIAARAAD
jgi:hypothetical protein